MRLSRVRRVLTLTGVLVVLGAAPALADPPGPTSYEATVVGVDPMIDGLEVRVLGGDSFLQIVNDGHEVVVPGYDGQEQYLRFDRDGTVSVNLRSVTHWQNEDRYAASPVPPGTGPDMPPQWVEVSDDGTWAWHDHRIHWMSPTTLPGQIDPASSQPQEALSWPVELMVDGQPVVVNGILTWLPPASPLPTIVAAVALVAVGAVVARRDRGAAVAIVVGLAVVVTGVVGLSLLVGLAPGVTADSFPLVLSGLAAVLLAVGLAVRGRSFGLLVAGAAGIPLLVWAATQFGAVIAPVVPPDNLPAIVARLAVGMAIGSGLAALGIAALDVFTRPLVPDPDPEPDLGPDPEPEPDPDPDPDPESDPGPDPAPEPEPWDPAASRSDA